MFYFFPLRIFDTDFFEKCHEHGKMLVSVIQVVSQIFTMKRLLFRKYWALDNLCIMK